MHELLTVLVKAPPEPPAPHLEPSGVRAGDSDGARRLSEGHLRVGDGNRPAIARPPVGAHRAGRPPSRTAGVVVRRPVPVSSSSAVRNSEKMPVSSARTASPDSGEDALGTAIRLASLRLDAGYVASWYGRTARPGPGWPAAWQRQRSPRHVVSGRDGAGPVGGRDLAFSRA